MEFKTYNQILNLLKEFADTHPQINSYDVGTELQIDLKKKEDYPKLFIVVGPATYNNPSVSASFTIDILDMAATIDEHKYVNEVLSDTFQIGTDLIHYLKTQRLINSTTSVNLVPLYNIQDGVLDGWQFNLDVATDFEVQSCYVEGYKQNAVKCIAAKKEYMSSLAGDYFGSIINGLNIEVEYSEQTENVSYLFYQGNTSNFNANISTRILRAGNQISFVIRDNGGASFSAVGVISEGIPNKGVIKVVGSGDTVNLYLDNVLIGTGDFTSITSFSDITNELLLFGATNVNGTIGTPSDATYNKVKIQTNEWTFPEGTGSTTTSSEGTITTLHSDVSTESMWVKV